MEATVASLFAAPMRMILAQQPSEHDAAHRLRTALFAQNLSSAQLAEFEQRFKVPLIQLYGMTETVVPPTMNPLYGERRGMSIGRPVTSARLRIVDERGNDVMAGEPGELLVHGEPGVHHDGRLPARSRRRPIRRCATVAAYRRHRPADADGYLYFVDRRKDLIKRAGENVASSEVERVLNEHPAVFESAVIGIPDAIRDEAIHVVVVLCEGATVSPVELIAFCRDQLAKFKVPDSVEIASSLPRTSVGKIQKHLLRPSATADPAMHATTPEGDPQR